MIWKIQSPRIGLSDAWAFQHIGPNSEGVPIKVLPAYGPHISLEGPDVEGDVIAEFLSVEAARQWYDSSAYQDDVTHRQRGAIYQGLIVEGTYS